MSKILEMFQGPKGKLSGIRVMFIYWMLFMTLLIGHEVWVNGGLPDIPENYYYITLVLAGSSLGKRYLERDGGITPKGEEIKKILNG
jgi:hypothetical protein